MTFTNDQLKLLQAPLDRKHVKEREQSGRKLSYVEGWHVIAEANRIFGFAGWTRETVDIRCVSEKERTIGQAKHPGWGVTYVARVRVCVGEIVREGCGSGHGIDRDLGQAHESAIKEAETDAMKRAFMTFGSPFGLALYDKEQANVTSGRNDDTPFPPDAERTEFIRKAKEIIKAAGDADWLFRWWSGDEQKQERRRCKLSKDEVDELKALVVERREQLTQRAA